MSNDETFLMNAKEKLLTAVKIFDSTNLKNLVIVDNDNKVIGTLGNHEIRDALLLKIDPETQVVEIIQKDFKSVAESTLTKDARSVMNKFSLDVLPILDNEGRYLSAHTNPRGDASILIMAGGLGSRLYPLTNEIPKPLILVGGKPVLGHIIDKYIESGFFTIYISVSFKSELILKWINKTYAHKKVFFHFLTDPDGTPLGTAGALTLLPRELERVIVHNADVLCDYDVDDFLDHHKKSKAQNTILTSKWEVICPYGVIQENPDRLSFSVIEKPIIQEWINGGIYVLDKSSWGSYQANSRIDMTEIIGKQNSLFKVSNVFHHSGEWIDMGTHETLRVAETKNWETRNEE